MTRNDILFFSVTTNLSEFHPILNVIQVRDAIRNRATFSDTGNMQGDYQRLRDQVEPLAEMALEAAIRSLD